MSDNPYLSIYSISKKGYKGKGKKVENRTVRINRIGDRCNNTFHLSRELARSYRRYAKMSGVSLAECVERAFIEDMIRNPVTGLNLTVNQIQEELGLRQEAIMIKVLLDQIRTMVTRYCELEGKDRSKLRERLIQLLKKGAEIKKPTEELIMTIEEAMNLI